MRRGKLSQGKMCGESRLIESCDPSIKGSLQPLMTLQEGLWEEINILNLFPSHPLPSINQPPQDTADIISTDCFLNTVM